MKKYDVVVLGGGPGGSVAGAVLAKGGLNVAVIEREEFPRFHIGESLLPASMPLFKEIGFYPTLASGKYLEKYGARFIDYRNEDEIYFGFPGGLNPDIPMAFEVPRAEFDKDLLQFAVSCGVDLYQPERVIAIDVTDSGAKVKTDKNEFTCDYVMDITGRDSLLGKKMVARQQNKDLNNVAVFSHYKGVQRYTGKNEGDITIGLLPDRAWTWIIPFKGDVTSVGVVCSSSLFDGKEGLEAHLQKSLFGSVRVANIMKDAVRVGDMHTIGNYSHTSDKFHGDRWILSGDAAMFIDPIFSSGVHLSISSSKSAAETVLRAFKTQASLNHPSLGPAYEAHYRKGAKRFYNLISLFYKGHFVEQMKKTLTLENMRKGFTSAVAGDVWNEDNFLFEKNVL